MRWEHFFLGRVVENVMCPRLRLERGQDFARCSKGRVKGTPALSRPPRAVSSVEAGLHPLGLFVEAGGPVRRPKRIRYFRPAARSPEVRDANPDDSARRARNSDFNPASSARRESNSDCWVSIRSRCVFTASTRTATRAE
jgi:hypothetical protein